jgi:hypothetical protein
LRFKKIAAQLRNSSARVLHPGKLFLMRNKNYNMQLTDAIRVLGPAFHAAYEMALMHAAGK